MAKQKFQSPGHYTKKDREKIPSNDFAGPHKSFPIVNQKDVKDAARLAGHAKNPAAVKSKIKEIAKSKGLAVPKTYTKTNSKGGKKRG